MLGSQKGKRLNKCNVPNQSLVCKEPISHISKKWIKKSTSLLNLLGFRAYHLFGADYLVELF